MSVIQIYLIGEGCGNEILDFLEQDEIWDGDIVTNPSIFKGYGFCVQGT